MTAELTPQIISIDNFIASKQIQLFQDLKGIILAVKLSLEIIGEQNGVLFFI